MPLELLFIVALVLMLLVVVSAVSYDIASGGPGEEGGGLLLDS